MHYSKVFKIRHLPYGPGIKYPFTGTRAEFILYHQQILLTRRKENRVSERGRERKTEERVTPGRFACLWYTQITLPNKFQLLKLLSCFAFHCIMSLVPPQDISTLTNFVT